MAQRDPLWVLFPRWLEESGLPRQFYSQVHPLAWLLFRKLVEWDCENNLTPGWFSLTLDALSEWTGLEKKEIRDILLALEDGGWIEGVNVDQDTQQLCIVTPLPVPIEEEEIRSKLMDRYSIGGHYILRYYENIASLSKVEKVIFLYQMLFGARFTPRIVEDLEMIANTYDMGVIYDTFQEAYQKKVKSLSWIKTHLHSEKNSE